MANQRMNRKPWKKRKIEDTNPVFIFETTSLLKGAAKKTFIESLKEQIRDGVVLLNSNTTLVYAGKCNKFMVVEK